MQFVLFTDNLHELSINDALVGAKKAGFDGIDLTFPLADGQAPLPEFMAYLQQQLKYDGVASLYSEYQGDTNFRRLSTDELLEQSAKDLTYLKSLRRQIG